MLQDLIKFLSSPFTEIAILFVLLIAFFIHRRKDPRLVASGVELLRTLILVLIFFYLMFVWVSAIRPILSAISIFGMFLINLVILYHLILARLERPYRDALTAMTQEPERHELIQQVWHSGKRFYYFRHAGSSLFSGANPWHFLHNLATNRVQDDIKDSLRQYGVKQKMITIPLMAAYLKSQIAGDANMPGDFKDVIDQAIDAFAKHPWIQEQGNAFLSLATERPEALGFPEWMAKFEAQLSTSKSKNPD